MCTLSARDFFSMKWILAGTNIGDVKGNLASVTDEYNACRVSKLACNMLHFFLHALLAPSTSTMEPTTKHYPLDVMILILRPLEAAKKFVMLFGSILGCAGRVYGSTPRKPVPSANSGNVHDS